MTTPTERAVLGAALRWHHADPADRPTALTDLTAAAVLLETERAAATADREMTFGELVVDDEIRSANGKWYTVARTVRAVDDTSIKVWLTGVPKPLEKFEGMAVTVRRSEMGEALDVFATVLWSGPTAPSRGAAA